MPVAMHASIRAGLVFPCRVARLLARSLDVPRLAKLLARCLQYRFAVVPAMVIDLQAWSRRP